MGKRDIAVVGLGKMGKNIALQMLNKGYGVVGHNRSPAPLDEIAAKGAKKSTDFQDMVAQLQAPRVIWLMLPAGEVTDNAINELSKLLQKGDIVVDGSNSMYKDSARRCQVLKPLGIEYLDAGCSGGPSGALNGMSIMVGGDKETFDKMDNIFKDLSVPEGYSYVGAAGSGHFVKMVHNAIEYGMMESIAEGLDLIQNGPYKNVDLAGLCHLWMNGSVIRSYLVELAERALKKDPTLQNVLPSVDDNGEGRWASNAAMEYGIPFTTIAHSVHARFVSKSDYLFGFRMLAALRHEFGGHDVKTPDKE